MSSSRPKGLSSYDHHDGKTGFNTSFGGGAPTFSLEQADLTRSPGQTRKLPYDVMEVCRDLS